MKLPSFTSGKKQKEYFLSLLLYPDAVDAAVWEIGHKGETIILGAVTQELLSDTWEERISASDKCVSTLEDLSKSQNFHKVILGLPAEYLTEDGDVKKEIKHHIKELTRLLDLTPMGFVSIYQAIIHEFKLKEGVPPSLILMGITNVGITVTLYKVGIFIGQRTLSKEGSLIGHLEDALASFTDVEILPSRIIIYGTNRNALEDAKRDILQYHWQQKANFLHFPKAEVISGDGAAVAVSQAGAQELVQTIGVPSDEIEEEVQDEEINEQVEETTEEMVEETKDNEDQQDIAESEEVEEESEPVPTKAVMAKDVPKPEESTEDGEEYAVSNELKYDPLRNNSGIRDQAEEFIDQGILAAEHANVVPVDPEDLGFTTIDEEDSETEVSSRTRKKFILPPIFTSVKATVSQLFSKKSKHLRNHHSFTDTTVKAKSKKKIALLIIPILLIAIIGYVLFTVVLPRAVIAVTVSPRDLQTQQKLEVTTEGTSGGTTIVGSLHEESVNGDKTITVTGKKVIGDPAKGTVTIFNKSLVSRTIKKGTVLSSGSIDFLLDDDVSVASASESLSAGTITYGKANGKVTAKDIGSKGNITSGRDLAISGLSSSIATARNEESFTGGTSKDITVVSRADQDNLIKELTQDLIAQAKNGFGVDEGEQLIAETIKTTVKEKTFSHEIGQETKELKGTATVLISGTAFKEEDVKSVMADSLNAQVPEGYKILPQSISVSIGTPVVSKTGDINVDATVTAKAVPSVDVSALSSQLAGKTVEEAETIIKQLQGVNNVSITVSSSMFKNKLPGRSENIKVSVESQ